MTSGPRSVHLCSLLLALCLVACNRPRSASQSAPITQATAPTVSDAGRTGGTTYNLTAESSEHVATNTADPHCSDCLKGDATGGPNYHGKPAMKLDPVTLEDAKRTIDATCDILEQGVTILEKYEKEPAKAAQALDDYRTKQAKELAHVFQQARQIKARLKSAGFDQDIPEALRPHFDERMTKIQERLELMRGVYRQHPAVLESFGALFPRDDR